MPVNDSAEAVSSDFYMWLNYLTFTSMTGDKQDVAQAYEDAVERLTHPRDKEHIWLEYKHTE